MNIQSLDLLLRVFQRGSGSPLRAMPLEPVAAAAPSHAVADQAALAQRPVMPPSTVAARLRDDAAVLPGADTEPRDPTPEGARTAPAGDPRRAVQDRAHANGVALDSVTVEPAPADPARTSAVATRFSPTAQIVSALMEAPPAATAHEATRPLLLRLDATPADVERLATALQRSIGDSGLFYEAHLAQWAMHGLSRADLAREPQAAWPASVPVEAAADARGADGTGGMASAGPAPAALAQVRMQLEALESGQIRWQGEPWPRQRALIEINADDGAPAPAVTKTPRWKTRVALTLPRLGRVEAEITLSGDSVAVRVRPTTPAAAAELTQAQGRLATALAARFDASGVAIDDVALR